MLAALAVAAFLGDGRPGGGGGGPRQPALVVGDSLVTVAARATDTGPVHLVGYPGLDPGVYADASSPLISGDLAAADRPRTVVLNWNGNNPGGLVGTQLIATYRAELTAQIDWYLRHGVTRIVLAAAVPSSFNSTSGQVDWTTPASRLPGWMLGSVRLNDLYRQLADESAGRVRYSERAARAIHPAMAFNTELDGHRCIVDFIHPAPYCAKRYAHALASLTAER